MPVKNPKLLQSFQYKGYLIDRDAELELSFLENRWRFEGKVIDQNNGHSFEITVEEEGPDQLVESLKHQIDRQREG